MITISEVINMTSFHQMRGDKKLLYGGKGKRQLQTEYSYRIMNNVYIQACHVMRIIYGITQCRVHNSKHVRKKFMNNQAL